MIKYYIIIRNYAKYNKNSKVVKSQITTVKRCYMIKESANILDKLNTIRIKTQNGSFL